MSSKANDRKIELSSLIFPKNYRPTLKGIATEKALGKLNGFIESNLESKMNLSRVNAPLFVQKGTGINDNLNGIEEPVSFAAQATDHMEAEVVQSLAKWKRMLLKKYEIAPGEGIYTDMRAIRPHEQLDNLHSLYVDQWDWELCINKENRNLAYLKDKVRTLYSILKGAAAYLYKEYGIPQDLPDEITFVHTEELVRDYPKYTPEEREWESVKKHGAIFLIGIGGVLSDGLPQDGRSPDYDDWSSPNEDGYFGLNGDILVWNTVLERPFELSSMGIRVDKQALLRQLELTHQLGRKDLLFHKQLLADELPLSLGGGIGKSRVGMFFLKKAHIGEVSFGLWPENMVQRFAEHQIELL